MSNRPQPWPVVNPDMQIDRMVAAAGRPLLSFEFFPPKDAGGMERLHRTVEQLHVTRPDFVSVTYGAGGSTRQRTLEVCAMLEGMDMGPVMPHLTCVGSSRAELGGIVDEIHGQGYRNIMVLRGDPPAGAAAFRAHPDGLRYARDLVELVRGRHPEICCGVAGYPETHPEAASPEADLANLKGKLDAGAGFATTQLFFDNRVYFAFVDRCRAAGITQPILPGLLPASSLKQVRRIAGMCAASVPPELIRQLEAAGGNAEAASYVGIHWVVGQIEGLLARGVPGIHLYILNRAEAGIAPAIMGRIGRTTG